MVNMVLRLEFGTFCVFFESADFTKSSFSKISLEIPSSVEQFGYQFCATILFISTLNKIITLIYTNFKTRHLGTFKK